MSEREDSPGNSVIYKAMRLEYDQLRAMREMLNRTAESLNVESLHAVGVKDLQFVLRYFQSRLKCHFQVEEGEGAMADLARHFPETSSQIESVLKEHEELNDKLYSLVSLLSSSGNWGAEEISAFKADLTQFLDKLEAHEIRENDLVLRASTRDIGTSD